jgi:transposase
MKMLVDAPDVYLYRDPVHFRKQINSLTAIVEIEIKYRLILALFFCYKRLENDKFKWPKKHELDTINISEEQLHWLLRGFNIKAVKAHNSIKFYSVYFDDGFKRTPCRVGISAT